MSAGQLTRWSGSYGRTDPGWTDRTADRTCPVAAIRAGRTDHPAGPTDPARTVHPAGRPVVGRLGPFHPGPFRRPAVRRPAVRLGAGRPGLVPGRSAGRFVDRQVHAADLADSCFGSPSISSKVGASFPPFRGNLSQSESFPPPNGGEAVAGAACWQQK